MQKEMIDESITKNIRMSETLDPGTKDYAAATANLKVLKELKTTEISDRQLESDKEKLDKELELEREKLEMEKKLGKWKLVGDVLKVGGTIISVVGGIFGLKMVIDAEDDDDKILPGQRLSAARSIFPKH